MEKINGYVGIACALALLFLLAPIKGLEWQYPMRGGLTPLDDTLVSVITTHHTDEWTLWTQVTHFMRTCQPNGKAELPQPNPTARQALPCSRLFDQVNSLLVIKHVYGSTSSNITKDDLDRYVAYLSKNKERMSDFRPTALERVQIASDRLYLSPIFGEAIAKYTDSIRKGLVIRLYFANLAVVLCSLLLVVFRRNLGWLVLWPVRSLFGASKVVAVVATDTVKKLHEKV